MRAVTFCVGNTQCELHELGGFQVVKLVLRQVNAQAQLRLPPGEAQVQLRALQLVAQHQLAALTVPGAHRKAPRTGLVAGLRLRV